MSHERASARILVKDAGVVALKRNAKVDQYEIQWLEFLYGAQCSLAAARRGNSHLYSLLLLSPAS